MANTYHQIYLQTIFAVKYREAVIDKSVLNGPAFGGRYGVFSYSQSQVDKVYKYIQNQEAHHKKQTFRDEYFGFSKKFKEEYDEKYIFQDLI